MVWEGLWGQCFLCIVSFTPLSRPVCRFHYYHHFGAEDTESQRGNQLAQGHRHHTYSQETVLWPFLCTFSVVDMFSHSLSRTASLLLPQPHHSAISRTQARGGSETLQAYCCSVPTGTWAQVLGIINPLASLKLVTLGRKRPAGEDKRNLDFCSLH